MDVPTDLDPVFTLVIKVCLWNLNCLFTFLQVFGTDVSIETLDFGLNGTSLTNLCGIKVYPSLSPGIDIIVTNNSSSDI
jgi:hypothetical protein